jgi:hypothetical protein
VREEQLVKLAIGATRETIESMLKSARIRSLSSVLQTLKSNPYLKKEEAEELAKLAVANAAPAAAVEDDQPDPDEPAIAEALQSPADTPESAETTEISDDTVDHTADATVPEDEAVISSYLQEHADDIAAEGDKPFQAIGGIVDLLGENYFPVTQSAEAPAPEAPVAPTPAAAPRAAAAPKKPQVVVRENALQKINRLDVKGRIQLALKGNKEERSLLIRDGTKVVALAVLEAPKLSDGEVEKFASQKNVLESVLRQIPLKRRFMKNYKVVRNLVSNPRTPLDLGLGLMKHLLSADLKNISGNKEVSETVRKLAMKMYKQKEEQAAKK